MSDNPLGQATEYALHYSPQLLFAAPRIEARQLSGIGDPLPFSGVDRWNAWDFTWLNTDGKPVAATAEICVDVESPNVIESKSLKLYLNSFAMTRYADVEAVSQIIQHDISGVAQREVVVVISIAADWSAGCIAELPGICIDKLNVDCDTYSVDSALLQTVDGDAELEELHSHLFRSNCPITNQPDVGSVIIRYSGPSIDRASLLRYLVSYRQHNAFHEACIESIFIDVLSRCQPRHLSVAGYFQRRGGLDINPFRSNFEGAPDPARLWRQ